MKKIYERELIRLSLSLEEAVKLENDNPAGDYTRVAVLHYPPVSVDGIIDEGFLRLFSDYGVRKCIYGHLHGNSTRASFNGSLNGIDFYLTSADYLGFAPLEIK